MKKEGRLVSGILLFIFLCLWMVLSFVPAVEGACFIKTFPEIVEGSTRDCSIDWWTGDCEDKGGRHIDRGFGSNDCCILPTTERVLRNQCYTRAAPFSQDDNKRDNQVCLITASDLDGACVAADQAGDHWCTIDGRDVSITREEFDKLDDATKQKCPPGTLKPDDKVDRPEIIARVNLANSISADPLQKCGEDQVVCGAKELKDDPADKTGLDFVQCCTLNNLAVGEATITPFQFPPKEDPKQQEQRTVQCEESTPVMCGAIKDAQTNEFKQLACCVVQENGHALPIQREPRIVLIKDEEKEKLCDTNEFACGFVQAKGSVGGFGFGGGNEQFIDAPGGMLCCKDLTAAERLEDIDEDSIQNKDDLKCPNTPRNERLRVIKQRDVDQHSELAEFIGCGQSELDADANPFICEEKKAGTWRGRKANNRFSNPGACCGGDGQNEFFSMSDGGVVQACIANQAVEQNKAGGNSFFDAHNAPGQISSVSSIFGSGVSVEVNSGKESQNFVIQNRINGGEELVLFPGKIARSMEVNNPVGLVIIVDAEVQVKKTGDRLRIRYFDEHRQPHDLSTVEYSTGAFQRFKLAIPSTREKRLTVDFTNQGEKNNTIRNVQMYAHLPQKILHTQGSFLGCALADFELAQLQKTNPSSEANEGPLVTSAQNHQPSCAAKFGNAFCSLENIWKFAEGQVVEKSEPSAQLFREIGINAENVPRSVETDCCAATECWDGARCVQGNFDGRFFSANQEKALFCSNGEWKVGDRKTNQFGDGSRVCPGDACAYAVAAGARTEMTCKPDGFFGPANNGDAGEDVFCDAGTWTSRPVKLASVLAHLPDTRIVDRAGLPYSIYCDTPEEVLVNKEFSAALPGDVTHFFENGGAAYACVLQTNTHALLNTLYKGLLSEIPLAKNQVIVALALTEPDAIIKSPAAENSVLSALDTAHNKQQSVNGETLFTQCLGVFKYHEAFKQEIVRQGEEFHGCTGVWDTERARTGSGFLELKPFGKPTEPANVWYSKRLNALLYSPKAFKVEG